MHWFFSEPLNYSKEIFLHGVIAKAKKVYGFWSPTRVDSAVSACQHVSIFSGFFFLNFVFLLLLWNDVQLQPEICWIDWNSAVLCFKGLFHLHVHVLNVCPIWEASLLATILCVWEICYGSNNCVYMYHIFHWLAKKKIKNKKITPENASPHRFGSPHLTRNQRPFNSFNLVYNPGRVTLTQVLWCWSNSIWYPPSIHVSCKCRYILYGDIY